MRLFLALRFDRQMDKELTSLMHDLKVHGVKGNFAPSQNLHMTLVFIGETSQTDTIKTVIGSITVPSMRITLDKLSKYNNVLVAEAKTNQKMKEYVASVKNALDGAGIDCDHKKFSPHITLVRKAAGGFKEIIIPKTSVTCTHVSLMKSVRKDGKMVYTEIAGWDGKA